MPFWVLILMAVLVIVPSAGASDPDVSSVLLGTEVGFVESCNDPLGCVVLPPGAPIRLGTVYSAGFMQIANLDTHRGVEIAISDRGTVLGRNVELVTEDDGCTAWGGQNAATRIVADGRVVAVVGHICNFACREAGLVYTQAGFTMVSPGCYDPRLTDPVSHTPSFLRVAKNSLWEGDAMGLFAYNVLTVDRAALAREDVQTGTNILVNQAFADSFIDAGGVVARQEVFDPTETNFGPLLTRVAASNSGLLYVAGQLAAAGQIASQARGMSSLDDTILAGVGSTILYPGFLAVAGNAWEGMYFTHPFFVPPSVGYDRFLIKYQQQYGQAPVWHYHAHAYDATNMILDAVEAVGRIDINDNLIIGRQALRDELYAMENWSGLTGNVTCRPSGDCASSRMMIAKVINRQLRPLYYYPSQFTYLPLVNRR